MKQITAALAIVCATGTLGESATVSYTTPFSSELGGWNVTFTPELPKFDNALGTLLSVQYSVTSELSGQVEPWDPDIDDYLVGELYVDFIPDWSEYSGIWVEIPEDLDRFMSIGPWAIDFSLSFAPTEEYIGPGPVGTSFFYATIIHNGGPSIAVTGDATITYEYEPAPVPEPGTFTLWVGLGLMGLVAGQRSRRVA